MRTPIIPEVWGQGAETTIPANPVKGTTYRDVTVGQPEFEQAWPFDKIVNSAEFNQALFIISSVVKDLETYGIAEWSNAIDYPVNAWARGSDGQVYKSLQTPNVNKNPVTATSFWEALSFGGGGTGGLAFGGLISGATNLAANTRYLYSANSIVTHTLPAGPANGDRVILDHNEDGTSIVTVSGNGKNIRQFPNPTSGSIQIDVEGAHIELLFSASDDEWIIANFSGAFETVEKASLAEVLAGINAEKFVTPETLQGKLDSQDTDPLVHARVRLAEQGNTPVLIDSSNIASVVRSATGLYIITFINDAPNTDYYVEWAWHDDTNFTADRTSVIGFLDDGNDRNAYLTTSSFYIAFQNASESNRIDVPAPGAGYVDIIVKKSNF